MNQSSPEFEPTIEQDPGLEYSAESFEVIYVQIATEVANDLEAERDKIAALKKHGENVKRRLGEVKKSGETVQ